ncbi:MAG TPA: calcium/proton exchanger [Chloroflexota bacterium]|nr:calcium/proton exchanger [Chloroflexota bacterium]
MTDRQSGRTVAVPQFSGEQKVMAVLLLFVPATLLASHLNAAPALQFFLSVGSVIPLAAYISAATEGVASKLGGKVGGLLNATFGNAPDLLVGIFGVQKGLIPLVKATLVGALISNSALIMGLCYIVAGLRFRHPRFNRYEAGHHSVLMMLTIGAILFPSVGALFICGDTACVSPAVSGDVDNISVGVGIVLLLSYAAYVVYSIFHLQGARPLGGVESRIQVERAREERIENWPVLFSVIVLGLSTAALIPITDILTGSVEPVTRVLGWTQVFVGIVIVANAGNVAEGYAAIKFAFSRGGVDPSRTDSGLDLALGIASASSIQIATFVAPLVVLYSVTTHTMNLVFSPVEIAILALLVLIFTYTAQDGESNWLEGAQLLALYLMAAIVFFFLPVRAFV